MRAGASAAVEGLLLLLCTCVLATPASVEEDALLNMTGLANKYGYPMETHTVETEDGYLLTMYRMAYGRGCGPGEKRKAPVLLQHGLLSSSADFLIMGPRTSLGYILADKCYDVWFGNNRGNKESRKHRHFHPKEKHFWEFSWHQMGVHDLPALVDHILNTTGHPHLHYIGHSQGTTQFFVFASLRPDYHHKIRTMHALSPVVFMDHLTSPLVRGAHVFRDAIVKITDELKIYDLPGDSIVNKLGIALCKDEYPQVQDLCAGIMFLLCGFDQEEVNKTMLPAIIGHTPAGTGRGPMIHYSQGIDTGDFRQFDYGKKINLKVYNNTRPPRYPIDQIKVPVAIYYGQNDFLAALKDVARFAKLLPNLIEDYLVPYSKFNHLDFLFAIDVKVLLYDRLLQVLENHSNPDG